MKTIDLSTLSPPMSEEDEELMGMFQRKNKNFLNDCLLATDRHGRLYLIHKNYFLRRKKFVSDVISFLISTLAIMSVAAFVAFHDIEHMYLYTIGMMPYLIIRFPKEAFR